MRGLLVWDSRDIMTKKIAIIIGHPDPASERYARTMADAYTRGAGDGEHAVKSVGIGPTRDTVIGKIATRESSARLKWLDRMQELDRRAR